MLQRMNSPLASKELGKPASGWRERVYTIIFEADTRAGQRFDLWLIAAIIMSVVVVILDSVAAISQRYASVFTVLEWLIT